MAGGRLVVRCSVSPRKLSKKTSFVFTLLENEWGGGVKSGWRLPWLKRPYRGRKKRGGSILKKGPGGKGKLDRMLKGNMAE